MYYIRCCSSLFLLEFYYSPNPRPPHPNMLFQGTIDLFCSCSMMVLYDAKITYFQTWLWTIFECMKHFITECFQTILVVNRSWPIFKCMKNYIPEHFLFVYCWRWTTNNLYWATTRGFVQKAFHTNPAVHFPLFTILFWVLFCLAEHPLFIFPSLEVCVTKLFIWELHKTLALYFFMLVPFAACTKCFSRWTKPLKELYMVQNSCTVV